jgi:hypothetical protein
MSSLANLSSRKSNQKYMTKTARFREAFRLLKIGVSMRRVAGVLNLNRKTLMSHYSKFIDSQIDIDEYRYKDFSKKGRKSFLDENSEEALIVAAHSLDAVGHPVSRPSLDSIISVLHQKESRITRTKSGAVARSTLYRWRKKAKIPKKSIRNGSAARKEKSTVEYIADFYMKLELVLRLFNIKKIHMYNFD